MKRFVNLFFLFVFLSAPSGILAQPKETAKAIIDIIRKADDYWQANNKPQIRTFWDHATYHPGNTKAYLLTGENNTLITLRHGPNTPNGNELSPTINQNGNMAMEKAPRIFFSEIGNTVSNIRRPIYISPCPTR